MPARDTTAALRRLIPATLASNVAILFVGVFFAYRFRHGFHDYLLIWGIGLGVIGVLEYELVARSVLRRVELSADQMSRYRHNMSVRRILTEPGLIASGITAGLIAAARNLVAVDVVMSALIVLMWATSVMILRFRIRQLGLNAQRT